MRFDLSLRERRDRRAEDCAHRTFQDATARWEPDAARLRELIETAQTLGTENAPTPASACPVALKRGEIAFSWLSTVSLIETSLERDGWEEDSSEFSLHVLRNVDWQAGWTRESCEPGPEAPSVVDVGSVTITNQRVVFQGSRHARVWSFSKLLGIKDDTSTPWTAIAVSNQQKVWGLLYTEEEAEEFRFRLHLARAVQQGNREELVAALERERVQHDAVRPVPQMPGVRDEAILAVRGYTAWPRWLRVSVPIVALVLLGVMGAATVGQANSTFNAQSPLASFLPTALPGAQLTTLPVSPATTQRRTTSVVPTGPRAARPVATARPSIEIGATALPPAGSAATARRHVPRNRRPRSRPTSSPPPTTSPPTTTPPTTTPPTTTPPTTTPPTTTPPTTTPPTTTPPTTTPPTSTPPTTSPPGQDVDIGSVCSTLGALGYTSDGALAVCAGVDVSLLDLRWVLA